MEDIRLSSVNKRSNDWIFVNVMAPRIAEIRTKLGGLGLGGVFEEKREGK